MFNYLNAHRLAHPRLILTVFVVFALFVTSGCGLFGAKKKIQVPQLLPGTEAGRDRLFQEVNRFSTVTSIHGKVNIQFEDTSFATSGIADQYRLVDGDITLQRPGKIYLVIQFILVDIAQMTSDGEQFRVAVLKGDERYKRFVKGTNNAVYKKLEEPANTETTNSQKKVEKETVSALSNLRPQHLTDAFMIRPIDPNGPLIYAQSEFFQEEADTRRGAQKNARVMRPYYVLDEFSQTSGNEAKLARRLWFDRVSGIRLARIQSFDDAGVLVTDVAYYNEKPLGAGPTVSLPNRIEITRPQDQYKLSITYQDPSSVELDRPYPTKAFVLENKWGLKEVDLDATHRKITANK
ncbi:MAG TPA: hypothetical protein VFO99_14845 [Pyrinomonadaceae bacterium]|nr:hypothetical protein [Pyrinomonadaceae bacterium]